MCCCCGVLLSCGSWLLTFKLKRFVCKPPTTLIARHPFNHATDWLSLCCQSIRCHIVSYHAWNSQICPTGMSLLCMHIKIALQKHLHKWSQLIDEFDNTKTSCQYMGNQESKRHGVNVAPQKSILPPCCRHIKNKTIGSQQDGARIA